MSLARPKMVYTVRMRLVLHCFRIPFHSIPLFQSSPFHHSIPSFQSTESKHPWIRHHTTKRRAVPPLLCRRAVPQGYSMVHQTTMAGRHFEIPDLESFIVPKVRPTGRELDRGAYGSVEEVEIPGAACHAQPHRVPQYR